jgi:hypothetical protein
VNNDKLMIALSTVVGAIAGGVAGYLFLTDSGRRSLRSLQPALDEIARDLGGVSQSLHGVTGAALTGWKLFDEFVNEVGAGRPPSSITH